MIRPVDAAAPVTQGFGNTDVPDGAPYSRHEGIDYGVPMDTLVVAAEDGIVEVAGRDKTGYGTYIKIAHDDGYVTLYAHLNKALVQTGDNVTQGQVIGRSGSTGFSTGPHLHFEVRRRGVKIDPETMYDIAQPQPQLKPLRYMRTIGQNVRSSPSIMGEVISVLPGDLIVGVLDEVTSNGDRWALLVGTRSAGLWAAISYRGQVFLEEI